VAAGAVVIVIEAGDRIEKERSADLSKPVIYLPAKPIFERGTDPTGKAVFVEQGRKLLV
jgi:hypothetical protein